MPSTASTPAGRAPRAHLSRFSLRALAAGVVALGYIDLVRGGMTAGPVLLVIGYVALVPAAMLVAGDA